MSHSGKVFRNSIFSLANKLVTIVLAFVTRKLFILFLSDELLGLNSLFADLLGLLNLADMGLGVAVQFNLYKPIAQKDEGKIGRILNAAKRIYNVVGIGMISAGVILSFFIQHLIRENPYELNFLRIVFVINVLSSASSYFFVHKRLYLQACEDLHITYFVDTVVNLLGSVLRIAAIAIFKNYYVFVLLTAVQSILSNYVVGYYCDKRHPFLKTVKGYTKEEMSSLFHNIKELVPNRISSYIFSNTDNTIISACMGLSSVALFTNYNSIVLQLFTLAAMLAGIVRAALGNVLQENRDKASHMLFLNSYQLLQFFYSSFCAVALFCLLDDFIALWYGEKYIVSLAFVVILTLDFFLHSMYQPLSIMLEVLGEFRALKRQEIFAMLVNVVVSVGLVFPFGIIGPIFGTFAVDVFTTAFRLHTIVYKNYRAYFRSYIKHYALYLTVFLVEYVSMYLLFTLLPFERSIVMFLVKGILCFLAVMGVNMLIFCKTDEFSYLKDRAMCILKRR